MCHGALQTFTALHFTVFPFQTGTTSPTHLIGISNAQVGKMIHSTSDISMMTPPPFQWRLSSGILIQPGNASHGHRLTSRSRQVTHPMLFLQVPSIYLSIHPFLDDLFWLLSTHEYHGFGARCLSSRFR